MHPRMHINRGSCKVKNAIQAKTLMCKSMDVEILQPAWRKPFWTNTQSIKNRETQNSSRENLLWTHKKQQRDRNDYKRTKRLQSRIMEALLYVRIGFFFGGGGLLLRGHLFHNEAMITATHMGETIADQKSTLKHTQKKEKCGWLWGRGNINNRSWVGLIRLPASYNGLIKSIKRFCEGYLCCWHQHTFAKVIKQKVTYGIKLDIHTFLMKSLRNWLDHLGHLDLF